MATVRMDDDDDVWSLPDTAQQNGAQEEEDDVDEPRDREEETEMEDDEEGAVYQRKSMRTWRAHWGYLYDTMLAQETEASSSVVQWLPDIRQTGSSLEARLMVGTERYDTDDRQHYVMVYKVHIPSRIELPYGVTIDEETGELGGRGRGPTMRMDVEYRLYHDGPVSALETWGCNPMVFATRSVARKEVYIFNTVKQPYAKPRPPPPNQRALNIPDDPPPPPHLRAQRSAAQVAQKRVAEWEAHKETCHPDLVLTGLQCVGDTLHIGNTAEGYCAAGTDEGQVMLWKLGDASKGAATLEGRSLHLPSQLGAEVNFVQFNPQRWSMLAGGSKAGLWLADVRAPGGVVEAKGPADAEYLCADWCTNHPVLLAIGDSMGRAHVVDIRRMDEPLKTVRGHQQRVYTVKWSPHQPSTFATGSTDSFVCLWDLRGRDNGCHPPHLGEGGTVPNELFFKHAGHSSEIGQVSWIGDVELRGCLASIEVDMGVSNLQVWRPRNAFWPDPEGEERAHGP